MAAIFVPHDKNSDSHVNRKDLSSEAKTVEGTDIIGDKLPSAPDVVSDGKTEEETAEINPGDETQTLSDVYVPEVVARRTAVKSDTSLST